MKHSVRLAQSRFACLYGQKLLDGKHFFAVTVVKSGRGGVVAGFDPLEGIDLPLFPLNYGTVNPDGTVNVFNSSNAEKPKEPGDGSQTGVGGTNVSNQE